MKLFFKNFTNLTPEEILLVWNARNSPIIRNMMYNQEYIPFEKHKEWIFSLSNNNSCLYFLVYADDKPIGVVDFTHITNDSCEWGFYLTEAYLGSGYGVLLEYYIIQYAFSNLSIKTLYCAVLDKNKNVYKTHVQFFSFAPDVKYSSVKNINEKLLHFDGLSLTADTWKQWNNAIVLRALDFFKVESVKWGGR